MYLSDGDLEEAVKCGKLIVEPFTKADPTSIDLHLDRTAQAKIWDIGAYEASNLDRGAAARELRIGRIRYGSFSRQYLCDPPTSDGEKITVWRRGDEIIVKPGGFVLWQTKETVGTPEIGAEFILFVDGKSTRTARTGLVVHLTAPTIHASWSGQVTLEIANFGPFDIVLTENDPIAQIVVAKITNPPRISMKSRGSVTVGQKDVSGTARDVPEK